VLVAAGQRGDRAHREHSPIQHPTGNVTVYRKHHKPALGPLGDSLEDFK